MEPKNQSTPFVNRDMLRFEGTATFGLRIRTVSVGALNVQIKGMTREGPFTYTHTTTGTGTFDIQEFRIPDVPIMVSVVDQFGQFLQGGCYVTLSLTVNGDIMYELCSGQVFGGKSISYPNVSSELPRPTGGLIYDILNTAPAAGVNIGYTVPAGQTWRIIACSAELVTSAAVANRRARIEMTSDSFVKAFGQSTIDQTASQTRRYCAANYGTVQSELAGTFIAVNIPGGVLLPENSTIFTQTINIQAGDQWTGMSLLAEVFFNPLIP